MPADKPVYLTLCTPDLAAQLEGCILSFFRRASDLELLKDNSRLHRSAQNGNITVIICFGGNERGFLAFSCSELLARQLTISMLGETEDLADSCLCSVVGEIASILTESMLDNLLNKKRCKISVPTFIHNDNNLIKKLLADTRGYTGSFFQGTEQVLIKLVIHPEECMAPTWINATGPITTTHQAHLLFSCPRFGKPCKRLQVEAVLDGIPPGIPGSATGWQARC